MKRLSYLLMILTLLVGINSCGGGGGSKSYELDKNKNHVLLGPIKNATVSIYKLNNLKEPVSVIKTNERGAFSVAALEGSDDDYFLVEVKGGEDIDINDDKIIDSTPTPLKSTLHALVKKSDIEKNRVNITALSEMAYQYLKDYLKSNPNMALISNSDLDKLYKLFANSFIKAKSADEAYQKLISFSPLDQQSKKDLLIEEKKLESFARALHKNMNSKQKEEMVFASTNLPIIPKETLDNLKEKSLVLLKKPQSLKSVTLENITLKNNSYAFVSKNKSFKIKIDAIEDGYKILRWHGCDKVENNKKECEVIGAKRDRLIVPVVVPEIKINRGVVIKDISNIIISVAQNQNDSLITIALNDLNQTERNLVNSLQKDNIVVHKQTALFTENNTPIFFGKIKNIQTSGDKKEITVVKESLFDIFEQGYLSTSTNFNKFASVISENNLIAKFMVLPDGTRVNLPLEQNSFTLNFKKGSLRVSSGREFSYEKNFSKEWKGVKIDGNITLEPYSDFDLTFKKKFGFPVGIKFAYLKTGINTQSNIKATYDKNKTFQKDKNITTIGPYCQEFTIGPIPVVLCEDILLHYGVDFKAELNATAGAHATINPELEAVYDGDAYINFNMHSQLRYNAKIKGTVDAYAYLGLWPAVYVYGFGVGLDNKFGPYADAVLEAISSGNVEFDDLEFSDSDYNVTLAAGVKLDYGLKYKGEIRFKSQKDIFKKITDKLNSYIKDSEYTNFEKKFWVHHLEYNKSLAWSNFKPGYIEVEGPLTSTCKKAYDNDENIKCEEGSNTISFTIKNPGDTNVSWRVESDYNSDLFDVEISQNSGTLQKDESSDITVAIDLKRALSANDKGEYTIKIKFYKNLLLAPKAINRDFKLLDDAKAYYKPEINMPQNALNTMLALNSPKYIANINVLIYSAQLSTSLKNSLHSLVGVIQNTHPVITDDGKLVIQNVNLAQYASEMNSVTVYKTSYNYSSDSCNKDDLSFVNTIKDLNSSNIILANKDELGLSDNESYCLYFVGSKKVELANGKTITLQTPLSEDSKIVINAINHVE